MPADPTLADLLAELRAVKALIGRQPQRLLPADAAADYLGLGRTVFYRAVSAGEVPGRVETPSGPRWDVRQLDKYADGLGRPGRRRRKPTTKPTT